jgi:hypothetical protein
MPSTSVCSAGSVFASEAFNAAFRWFLTLTLAAESCLRMCACTHRTLRPMQQRRQHAQQQWYSATLLPGLSCMGQLGSLSWQPWE